LFATAKRQVCRQAAALSPFIAKTIPWTKRLRRIETGGRTRSEEVAGPAVSSDPGRSYAACGA